MPLPQAVVDRLRALAPDQRAAATAPPGPLLCVAPAGSGKTTTLVARITALVGGGADPATVCAVTFNKRAADELGSRLEAALAPLGMPGDSVRVRTFHALGREVLTDAGADVTKLVDRADVLQRLLGADATPARLRRLDDAISRMKLDRRLDLPAMRRAAGVTGRRDRPMLLAAIAYEEALRADGSLDFDDLVARAVAALEHDAGLLARWQGRCRHLLVDEVQDLDRTQLQLALLLAGKARNVFLVGDDDQTIYAWRLADVRRVIGLAAVLPGLRRVDLVTNYRCPEAVVRRAVRLVEHNEERFRKQIRARDAATGSLVLAPDGGDDVARARSILNRLGRDEGRGRLAVLARTNAELAPFAAVALEQGIEYSAEEDGVGLLDEPRLGGLLAAISPGVPAAEALGRCGEPFAATVAAWALPQEDAAALLARITHARVRRAELRRDDASLVLATVHGTKGLEFDRVVCVGLDDGRFPSARSIDEGSDPIRTLEEERRLAYVAWTRARKLLVLVYDPGAPSRFMTEAFEPAELVA